LQQSLLPAVQFTAAGAPFDTKAPGRPATENKDGKNSRRAADNGVYIVPKVEILPH